MMIGLSALSVRLVQIQLVDRLHYAERSRRSIEGTEILPAMRGMIVDRNEEPLAKSIPVSSVYVNKVHLSDPKVVAYALAYQQAKETEGWEKLDETARRRRIQGLRGEILVQEPADVIVQKHLALAVGILARPLGMRREELREKIESNNLKYFPIAKDLPTDVADRLREAIDENMLEGFRFENSIKRWYTSPNLATHLTGFTGEVVKKDQEGKTQTQVVGRFGIESTMEEFLAGRDGWRKYQRDSYGLVVPGNSASLMPPRSGLNVQLTIDMGMQSIVEEELDAGLKEFQSLRGTAILMDPKTGEILAMANRPHFDLNHKENLAESGVNYAIQATYEPGSTIKVVATAAALNEGLVQPQTMIFCHNGLFQNGPVRVTDEHPAGMLSFEGILQKSINIGTYKIALQLGPTKFYDYLDKWGFGKKTGIQLSDESRGLARNTNNPVDFSRACYGYATSVTPLQVACAYSVIASDGKLRKPKIVKSLIANDGTTIQEYPPEVVSTVLKPATAVKMRAALTKVTEKGGTATPAAVDGFKVAGKTGTAQKFNPKGGYFENQHIVSFVGMMPANEPAFVCIVVVDDPRTTKVNIFGGSIAGPIFKKIAERVAVRMNLQPTEPVSPPLAISEKR